MEKNDLIYIQHIKESIVKIQQYTVELSESDFLNSPLVQDAVIRNLEVIGEATKKLSVRFKERYAFVEWRKIAGMRDKLIHDYIGVDLWAVWGVVDDIMPEFKKQIDNMLTDNKIEEK